MQRADGSEPPWIIPIHASHYLVSKGGATVAVFAPPSIRGKADTPFLTLYRKSGTKIEFGYGLLYDNLLKTPDAYHPLSWGQLLEVRGDDEFSIRSVRGELFKFSMKDEN